MGLCFQKEEIKHYRGIYMLVKIEFRDGKIRDYDVDIDYNNRVIDIMKEANGYIKRTGFFPFEAVTAVMFEEEE